jgi:hypothetical protein
MRKSGLTGDEAYVLSKHGKTTEDLGPLKKELSQLKEDTAVRSDRIRQEHAGRHTQPGYTCAYCERW